MFVNFANGISCYRSPSPLEKKKKKSPDNRSSSPQCVNRSYLYKHLQTQTFSHAHAHTHTHMHTGLGKYSQNSLPQAAENEKSL